MINDSEPGKLANNGMTIMSLAKVIRSGDFAVQGGPHWLKKAIIDKAWQDWVDAGGRHTWKESQFKQFIETQPPNGLGAHVETLFKIIAKDTEEWVLLHEAIRGEAGGANNPEPKQDSQTGMFTECTVNHDNVMVDGVSTQSSNEGNSVSYAVRRLGKNRPDLLDRVKSGELTCNAAMVEAGFRAETITIPNDPEKAARRLLRHFDGERLCELIAELANHAGYNLTPKE